MTQTQNTETVEKKKVYRNHKIWTTRFMTDDGESVALTIKVSSSLRKLLNKFAVTGSEPTEHYFTQSSKGYRYFIKRVILNSPSWLDSYYVLFSKAVVDNGEVTIKAQSVRDLREVKGDLPMFRTLIGEMESLLKPNKTKIEYVVLNNE